jgi:sulfatase maturation enzyme AslB (radical SAM superfamily)
VITRDGALRSLAVLATAECNLSCTYCHRRGGARRRLRWPDCRAALDWALRTAGPEIEVVFTGGEPLLAEGLLRRAVQHVESRAATGPTPAFVLQTNGTLLGEAHLEYLAAHRFEVRVSCDGHPAAQRARGRGTWRRVTGALRLALGHEPWRRTLAVAVTVTPANARLLADSVNRLVEMGVPRIDLTPSFTAGGRSIAAWGPVLDDQFRRLHALSLEHWRRTGAVPLRLFRWTGISPGPRAEGRPSCAACAGESAAVDATGEIYRCALFVGSAPRPSAAWRTLSRRMSLGHPGPGSRPLAPTALGSLGAADVRRRHAAAGPCADCPVVVDCRVCPFAVALAGGGGDEPRRVPDFLCAFNLAAQTWKRRFPPLADRPPDAFTPALLPRQMRAWREAVAARH